MNTKIIILVFLSISIHNSFCMLINPNLEKFSNPIHKQQQRVRCIIQKSADNFLKPFMQRSILDNSEIFAEQPIAIQRAINRQCKDESPIIDLIQLPIEDQVKTISNFFDDKCRKAAEYFLSLPLEVALTKYNNLPENTLTLLQTKHTLPQSMIFRLTTEENRILTLIYTGAIISEKNTKHLKESLLSYKKYDILNKIQENNPQIIMLENENKRTVLLKTLYQAPINAYNEMKPIIHLLNAICLIEPPLVITCFGYCCGLSKKDILKGSAMLTIASYVVIVPAAYLFRGKKNLFITYEDIASKTITKPLKSLL